MTNYIMGGEGETERLRFKTEPLLVRRHLSWAGLARGESFLDVGCGTGEVVLEAARIAHAGRVMGVDGDAQRLGVAAQTCRDAGAPHVEFHVADVGDVGSSGLPTGAFDHAWSRFFLEYQQDPATVVRELVRLVRRGGKVTLIDLEGNGTRHFGMSPQLRVALDEVLADLAETGFDPEVGAKLPALANAAGLVDIRHEIEPYHRIVGTPDDRTKAGWRMKVANLRDSYLGRLFPDKADRAWVFDELLGFLERDDTMTWSLLHLVQGTKP